MTESITVLVCEEILKIVVVELSIIQQFYEGTQ